MRSVATFSKERLAKAIAIREQSYRLLLWISDAIDQGRIQPSRAAHHSGGPDAATEWMRENYFHIPEHLRPAKGDLKEFAAFFSTYLTSSFDVIERPGKKGEGPLSSQGCRCDLCLRIVNAPHLQAKKLYSQDKRRADQLMMEALSELATEHQRSIDESLAKQLVAGQGTRRDVAFVAYGDWLIRRMNGESDGPAILALWRIVAWDPRGGMRRGFQLRLDDILAARTRLLAAF